MVMVTASSQQNWIVITPEQAKRHPLYGINGWLLAITILITVNIVLELVLGNIFIERKTLGFRVILYVILVFLVISKNRNVTSLSWIAFPGLTLVALLALQFYFNSPADFQIISKYEIADEFKQGILATLFIRDIPIALYFTLSRRANVTMKSRVRPDDPFLESIHNKEPGRTRTGSWQDYAVGSTTKGTIPQEAGRTKAGSWKDYAVGSVRIEDETQGRMVPDNQPDQRGKSSMQQTKKEGSNESGDPVLSQREKASLVIEYSDEAHENYGKLSELPEEYRIRFADALETEPTSDTGKLAETILQEYYEATHPYDEETLNQALAEARNLGAEAEAEFRKVTELLGDKISTEDLLEKLKRKHAFVGPPKEKYKIARTNEGTFEIVDKSGKRHPGTRTFSSEATAIAAFEFLLGIGSGKSKF
jgi:hypothetical protein